MTMRSRNHILWLTGLMLFTINLFAQSVPVDTLLWNGPADERINLVIVPDGYTDVEMDKFREDARRILDALMGQQPFMAYDSFFNAVAILVPSEESGANHPGTATDVNEPVFPVASVRNRFGSRFDVAGIHRLLVPGNGGAIFSVLAENFPLYDEVMVLVNTPFYGGSGGTFATTSLHPSAPEIAIHEIGHSFAQLSDEYYAGDQYARETYNMTRITDPAQVRWKNWVGEQGVGIYQHCCGGRSAEYYRPHQDCKMRRLGPPFCPVCRERIIDRIYELVDPRTRLTPIDRELTIFPGDSVIFDLDYLKNGQGSNRLFWTLEGDTLSGDEQVVIYHQDLLPGEQELLLDLYDMTLFSRSYRPDSGYLFRNKWQISNCDGFVSGMSDSLLRCFGDSLLLTANGAERYEWSTGDMSDSIWVFGNGQYRIEMSRGACVFVDTVTVFQFEPPVVTGPILGADRALIGTEESYTSSGMPGSTYEWTATGGEILTGQGTDSVTVLWNDTPAELCVVEKTGSLCKGEARCLIVDVLFTHTIEQSPPSWTLRYGPNPIGGTGMAWVEGRFPGQEITWIMYDASGRTADRGRFENSGPGPLRFALDMKTLASGSYWMRIESGRETGWIKWVRP